MNIEDKEFFKDIYELEKRYVAYLLYGVGDLEEILLGYRDLANKDAKVKLKKYTVYRAGL